MGNPTTPPAGATSPSSGPELNDSGLGPAANASDSGSAPTGAPDTSGIADASGPPATGDGSGSALPPVSERPREGLGVKDVAPTEVPAAVETGAVKRPGSPPPVNAGHPLEEIQSDTDKGLTEILAANEAAATAQDEAEASAPADA